MAIKTPHSKFIDIYWIIPRNTHTPSCKVLLTRKERSPFKSDVQGRPPSLGWT